MCCVAFCSISDFNMGTTNVDEAVTVQGQNEDGGAKNITLRETCEEIKSSNSELVIISFNC